MHIKICKNDLSVGYVSLNSPKKLYDVTPAKFYHFGFHILSEICVKKMLQKFQIDIIDNNW